MLRKNKKQSEFLAQDHSSLLKNRYIAPARGLIWFEHLTMHTKVAGSLPSQSTYLGFKFNPQSGYLQEATDGCFLLSLKSINIFSGED